MRPNTYPNYRRRNLGRTVNVRGHVLDNRYVIPYNPSMVKKFHCHINLEFCGNLGSKKYIFSFVCKGNDRVNVQVHGNNNNIPYDEVDNYDVQVNRPIDVNNDGKADEDVVNQPVIRVRVRVRV